MVKDVKFTFVRDDFEEFVIDSNDFFILEDGLEGIDFADWTLYTEKLAFRDGVVVTRGAYSGRPISITFMSTSLDNPIREGVRRFFNPKDTYTLYVEYKGVKRWIECYIEGFELPTEADYKITKCTVKLFCEKPFFNSTDETYRDLNEITPMWGFPFMTTKKATYPDTEPAAYNPVFSRYVPGNYRWFDNNGDVDVYFGVYVYFQAQTTGFRIYQGFQELNVKFEFNYTFQEDDELFIDFERQIVLCNGQNFWRYVTKESQLLCIPQGGEYLSAKATTGELFIHPQVIYNEKFGGL